ncbi:uncharacterized protein I303_103419 [Kwoniella dejecticola CBS 10117]|uniref:Uncharacterized protein n=1 Tax=Kwoniella dejecticola CBS 10117 TaxID=1296121 RepID=A0A1A6A6P6_9TREE|nr:uncharacterized protein I303_03441 [Kwoniella dejecticola CBS 10117]OBR85730.1 hypothetical protein I303_03441 [Kwoniella dejecticola CBS 10117]
MASSNSKLPIFIASAIGALGAVYIVSPKTEVSGMGKPSEAPKDGRSQSAIEGKNSDESPSVNSPHPALRYGGAAPGSQTSTTVAGQPGSSRKSHSAEHDVKTRDDPTASSGQGLEQMRERKEKGMGLPSPQGGDSPAQSVKAQKGYNDGQGPPHPDGPHEKDTKGGKQSGGGWTSWFGGK